MMVSKNEGVCKVRSFNLLKILSIVRDEIAIRRFVKYLPEEVKSDALLLMIVMAWQTNGVIFMDGVVTMAGMIRSAFLIHPYHKVSQIRDGLCCLNCWSNQIERIFCRKTDISCLIACSESEDIFAGHELYSRVNKLPGR